MPIAFSCSCGKKLQVNDEFAGRRAKCQACGAIQAVPRLAPPIIEVNALEVVEDEPEESTFELVEPAAKKKAAADDEAPVPKKKKRKNKRTPEEVDEGSLAAMYMAEARENAEREEARAAAQGNDAGGWTFMGIHVTAGVLGGAAMLITGSIAMIAFAVYRDEMGPKAQGRAFVGAIVYTGIGLVTLFRALMGEEE